MAHAEQREVDLAAPERELIAVPPGGVVLTDEYTVAGSMTITFYDVGGHVIPKVSFAPLGRINPSTIDRYLPFIYQEIQKQQTLERKR